MQETKGKRISRQGGALPIDGGDHGQHGTETAKVEGGISIKHHRTKAEQEVSLPQQTQATDATVVVPVDY
jgi:hypothetical protein